MANPFVHVELASQDVAKSKEFYSNLFDWDLKDDNSASFPYTMIDVGENEYGVGGGMLQAPMPDMPTFWLAYVSVDDLEASTAKAKSLGATIVRDVTQVGDMGAFTIIQDPAGAVLGLWKSNQTE